MKGSLDTYKFLEFIQENIEDFEDSLLNEASNVKEKIEEILTVGNIDLINNAHSLIQYIIEGKEQELQSFATRRYSLGDTRNTIIFQIRVGASHSKNLVEVPTRI